jgi:hypothetical protein
MVFMKTSANLKNARPYRKSASRAARFSLPLCS